MTGHGDHPPLIPIGEMAGVSLCLRRRTHAIRRAVQDDRGHCDRRPRRQQSLDPRQCGITRGVLVAVTI